MQEFVAFGEVSRIQGQQESAQHAQEKHLPKSQIGAQQFAHDDVRAAGVDGQCAQERAVEFAQAKIE